MDYFSIRAQRTRFEQEFAGTRLESLRIEGRYTLFLVFPGDRALRLTAIPDMPYAATMERRFIPKNARPWHQALAAGKILAAIEAVPDDRILSFVLDDGHRLIFELTGRHTNIILVAPDGDIAGALRVVTGKESGVRSIVAGIPYIPPPREAAPAELALPDRLRLVEGSALTAVRRVLSQGSAIFAREVCRLTGVPEDRDSAALDDTACRALIDAAAGLAAAIETGGEGATILLRPDGIPQDVFPLKLPLEPGQAEFFDDLNTAVIRYAREREVALERKSLKNAVLAALTGEERRLRSTLGKVERERGDEAETQRLEQLGTILLSGLSSVRRGMSAVALPNIFGEGTLTVPLDSSLDGPANAEKFFRRARKLRAAEVLATDRIAGITRRLAEIALERTAAEALEDIRELRKLAGRHAPIASGGRGHDEEEEPFPRRFRSPSGLEIIVGRNDLENDALIRWAKKDDLWLHAQSIGGSHVILRSPGRQAPDHTSIEFAAAIAAWYSKGKTSAVVPVACTMLKYVVKRKGMGPGKVTYTREQVLFVEPAIPAGGPPIL